MARYLPRSEVVLNVLLEDFGDGSGEDAHEIQVTPRSVEINRNDYRTADTFRMELDWEDFPFDPRGLRSVHVRILLGDVAGTEGFLSIDDERQVAFVGFLDIPSASLGEGGNTVSLEGRDYTAAFLDARHNGGLIDVARPLSFVLKDIIAQVPAATGIQVVYANGADSVDLSKLIGRSKFATKANDDVWTVISELCGLAGLIPVIVLNELQILDVAARENTNAAVFLYGENLSSLSYRRNMQDVRRKQIEIRCWDEQSRTTLTARYPEQPVVTSKKHTAEGKVTTETEPIAPYYVSGTYTEADLKALAQRLYEQGAQRQVDGDLETKEMLDLDGLVDLPKLANGDRITLTLGTDLLAGIASKSHSEAVFWLTSRRVDPMEPETAEAIVTAFERARSLAASFRVQEATHRWDREDGYSLRLKFHSYIGSV